MLYVFDEISGLENNFPEQSVSYLSAERREKAFSYRFTPDKRLSVIVYLLLRLALKENYYIDEPVVFSYGKNGKPFLRDYPQIQFNMSHCRSAAVCAVSPGEIGVDVQEIIPVSDDLAKRVLTPREYAAFKSDDDPLRRFCEYWVIKESYLKKTGAGIGMAELSALSADSLYEKTLFANGKDYCGCVTGDYCAIRYVKTNELTFYT